MKPEGRHILQYESVNYRLVATPVQNAHGVFASGTDEANESRVFERICLLGG